MAGESLEIDGKTYVSSARAAQLVGYTKDYVGQLARAGKLESRLIGRSWYVSEDSIREHKLTVHYTLTKPKKRTYATDVDAPEKTIQYVDSSSARIEDPDAHERDVRTHESVQSYFDTNAHIAVGVPNYSEDSKEEVAIPTHSMTKQERDALVRSEFTYEAGQPVFYEDDRPVFPQTAKQQEEPAVETKEEQPNTTAVPVETVDEHKVLFRKLTSAPSRQTSYKPANDVHGASDARVQRQPYEDSRPQLSRSADSRKDYVKSSKVAPYQNFEHAVSTRAAASAGGATRESTARGRVRPARRSAASKAVPVVGALAVFALFAIAYMFL